MKLSGDQLSHYSELSTLASLIRCGILLVSDNTQLRFASPNACELLHYESENAIKERWAEVFTKLSLNQLQSIKAGHGPFRFKADYSEMGMIRLLRIEAYRLERENGHSYLLLLKDRQLLDNLSRQLLSASQMAIQGYLANALVHDLNGPINNIQLTLELLKSSLKELDTTSLPDEAAQRRERYQSVLKEETERLKLLIKPLPQWLNPPSAMPENFDLRPIIEEVVDHLRHEADAKQIRRSVTVPPLELMVTGPRGQIKLAMCNLAIILLETTGTGGTLVIKAERRRYGAEITLHSDAARLGEETISGLHELFFSSSDHTLGLYAARVIIESQSGDLTFAEETVDKIGFRVWLPLATTSYSDRPLTPESISH